MDDKILFTTIDYVDFEYERAFVSTDFENSLIYQVNSSTYYLYSLELRALTYDWPTVGYMDPYGFLYSHRTNRYYPCKSMLDAMCFLSHINNGSHPEIQSRRFGVVTDYLMKNTNLPKEVERTLYNSLFEEVIFEQIDNM